MGSISSDPPLRGSTGSDMAGLAGSVAPVGGKSSDNNLPTTVGY